MPVAKYSTPVSKKSARAYIRETDISLKDSMEIAREIKGLPVEKAKKILREVIEMKRAIPHRSHHRRVPHRKGKGFKAGKFPVKASKLFLDLIKMAEHNAEFKGLNLEKLKIKNIVVGKGRKIVKPIFRMPGETAFIRRKRTNLEIVVE